MSSVQLHAVSDRFAHHEMASVARLRCIASAELVRHFRNIIESCVARLGGSEDTAHTAKLLASELVGNAVRHTPQGTTVRIDVLHDEPCRIVLISVEDSSAATLPPLLPSSEIRFPQSDST